MLSRVEGDKVPADRELPQTLEWQWVPHVKGIRDSSFWRLMTAGLEDLGSAF